MRTRAEVVEGGAKVTVELHWLLYLCIKPETSEMKQKCFHAILKTQIFVFPLGVSGSPIAIGQC